MEHSTRFKIISGTVSVAIALTAGGAGAVNGDSDGDLQLNDVVALAEVDSPTVLSFDEVSGPSVNDDSLSSPFGAGDSIESAESPDSPESPDSGDSVDGGDSVDSPDSADSDSVDSPDSADSDSVDSPDSADSD